MRVASLRCPLLVDYLLEQEQNPLPLTQISFLVSHRSLLWKMSLHLSIVVVLACSFAVALLAKERTTVRKCSTVFYYECPKRTVM